MHNKKETLCLQFVSRNFDALKRPEQKTENVNHGNVEFDTWVREGTYNGHFKTVINCAEFTLGHSKTTGTYVLVKDGITRPLTLEKANQIIETHQYLTQQKPNNHENALN